MKMLKKISYFIPAVVLVVFLCFLLTRNYDKAGDPVGEDIPVAKSIADIQKYSCFTIEVAAEDIKPLREFRIKNFADAGIYESTKPGKPDREVKWYYAMKKNTVGDVGYKLRQIDWNLDGVSYGEYCVITLESGEKVMALLDLLLVDLPEEGTIKLPIGTVREEKTDPEIHPGKYKENDVDTEDGYWYVDMVGQWQEAGNNFPFPIYVLCFMGTIVSLAIAFVKIQEKR